MSSDIAIAVKNLSKCYQTFDDPKDRLKQIFWRGKRNFGRIFWALNEIEFEVKRGETVGIVGRNGSGKSTLLQIICGTVTPTTGVVERVGRVSALLELGSGFNPEFSGRENVFLNGALLGLSEDEVSERFEKIAAFADIGDFINSPVKHYSSGMFARLAFAVAIHVDPEILIVDEILAVGDAAFQRRCLSKFYEVRERGCTILFVSHDQYQVKSVCQRALYLEGGRQKMFGDAGRVIDAYKIDSEMVSSSTEGIRSGRGSGETLRASHPISHNRHDPLNERKPGDEAPVIFAKDSEKASDLCPIRIEYVRLSTLTSQQTEDVKTGEEMWLEMMYRTSANDWSEHISFAFNLYRHDDLYICGTTTIMDGIAPVTPGKCGLVKIKFPSVPLLGGEYKFRVAINDRGGFATIAEAKDVCRFRVVDEFEAVGLVSLAREWHIDICDK